jgi:D-alanyl-D-alanine carboxypeptidase/D-alanyl-D-alanine-endopeptidase (penicillin-binding protein 4)
MSGKGAFGVALLALAAGVGGVVGGWMLRERSLVGNARLPEAAQTLPIESGPKHRPSEPVTKSPAPLPLPEIGNAFETWSKSPELAGALLGFCVFDDTGKLLYGSPLAETALCPASALKTLTSGAAFGLLGPEFRFRTRLLAPGKIADGRIIGDLVLEGSGDPTLSKEDLEEMAEEAVKLGLKRVEGSLRVDATVFPAAPVNEHWNWGDIGNAYGTGAFGVNVGHNVLSLSFDPGAKEGDPAKFLGSDPVLAKTRWDTTVTTGPPGSGDKVMIYSSPYSEVIQVEGTVPLGEPGFTVRGSVPNPPALAGSILRGALEKRGVIFGGETSEAKSDEKILAHDSAPLAVIVDHLHDVSDNLESQCLFLTMGIRRGAAPEIIVRKYWEDAGIAFVGLRLIDGSGLARATMIRPLDLARVNLAARRGPSGERFLQSLPVGSNGALRSKRGAMSGVRTEVGFVIRGGKEYPFALMANGLGSGVDFWRLRAPLLDAIGK